MSLPRNLFSKTDPAETLSVAPVQRTAVDELEEGPPKTTTLVVPSYGGVRVYAASSSTEAVLGILNFLVERRDPLDALLTQYGLLVEKLKAFPENGFCVRRSDTGWALLVPEAQDRVQALLQIVQVLLEIARGPHAAALRAAGITPYRDT